MGNTPSAVAQMGPQPVQPQSPIDTYVKAMQLRQMQGQQQTQQLQQTGLQQENQQRSLQLQDQQATTAAMHDWDGKSLDDLPGLILKHNGSANAVFGMREQIVKQKQSLATLDKDTLANQASRNDFLLGSLRAVSDGPDEGISDRLSGAVSDAVQKGYLDPQHAQAIQHLNGMDPGTLRQQLGLMEKSFMGQKQQFDEAVKGREVTDQDITAGARKLQSETDAGRLQASMPGGPLYSGNVTPKDRYVQGQENLRATLGRQATFSNELQKNGLTQLDKMFTDPTHGYTQFLSQAQSTKDAVQSAKDGSELAASLVPLMTALGITSFAGIHRVNQNEINAAGPQVGSILRQVNTVLDKATKGKMNTDTARETTNLIDGLIDAKHLSVVQGAKMVAANNGLDPQKTMVMGRDGSMDTLQNVASGSKGPSQGSGNGPQKGYSRIKASDGSIHDIPSQNLGAARQRDPKLQVIQ